MGKIRLDPKLLAKLGKKLGKKPQPLREQISRTSAKMGISSEAVLAGLCKDHGIGTATYLNRNPHVRLELSRIGLPVAVQTRANPRRKPARASRPSFKAIADVVITDPELHSRCRGLFALGEHFDRVVREATTVLDDRLKRLTGISGMNGSQLVGKVLNPDPAAAVLRISSDPNEQRGFHSICNGIMLAFRNPVHHTISDKFTAEDAMRFCAFVDTLLHVIAQGQVDKSKI